MVIGGENSSERHSDFETPKRPSHNIFSKLRIAVKLPKKLELLHKLLLGITIGAK